MHFWAPTVLRGRRAHELLRTVGGATERSMGGSKFPNQPRVGLPKCDFGPLRRGTGLLRTVGGATERSKEVARARPP